MENYNRADTIKLYFEKVDSKKIEFSQLRKELESTSIEADEINVIVKQVDSRLIKADQVRAEHDLGKNLFYGGGILAIAGLLFTIATYTGFIDLGGSYIIAYGPFVAGLLIAMSGKTKMNSY